MSVTSNDLKSMLSRVRRADAVPPPSIRPKQILPPDQPPPASVPQEAPQQVTAAAAPAGASDPASQTPEEVLVSGSTDVGSILSEIMEDEDLMTRILGILYRAKKQSPNAGAVAIMPMERELGIARESATFVLNYMKTKHFIEADDKSRNLITVEGIDFLRTRLSKP
jgi:hypothetical protein